MKRKMYAQNFYSGNVKMQQKEYEAKYELPTEPKVVTAGIVPHAGWIFSGEVAHKVFKTVAEKNSVETYILLGAVHTYGVNRISLYPSGQWETPVGDIEVDEKLAQLIYDKTSDYTIKSHRAHIAEHSIEVQLPFIKILSPHAKIVPIAVPPVNEAIRFGKDLAELLKNNKPGSIVVIASSDLTHYGTTYHFTPAGEGPKGLKWMKNNDKSIIEKCLNLEAEQIYPESNSKHNACGPGGITAVTMYAKEMGRTTGNLLEYTTSFDKHPDSWFSMGVGYAAIVF